VTFFRFYQRVLFFSAKTDQQQKTMSNKRKLEDNVEQQLHIQKKRRLEPHLAPAQTCRSPATDVTQDSQDNLENSNSFDSNNNNMPMTIEGEEFLTMEVSVLSIRMRCGSKINNGNW
jgi:hypothetical protein